jgi:hypothetical protein
MGMLGKKSGLLLEAFFWVFCLFISYLYTLVHGFTLVGDGYIQQAQAYYYVFFGGTQPSPDAMQVFAQRGFWFRPIYPILSAFLAKFLTLFVDPATALTYATVFVNIICGFLTLIAFGKLVKFITNSEVSERVGRFLLGTTPTFIVFWTVFSSTDVTFLLPFTFALYYLLRYEKEPENKKILFLFLITTGISCLVRETGLFLIFPAIAIFFRSHRKTALFLQIGGFLILFFGYYYLSISGNNLNAIYLYENVFPIDISHPSLNLNNVPHWLILLITFVFNINTFEAVIPACIWAFGFLCIWLILSIYKTITAKYNSKFPPGIRRFNEKIQSFPVKFNFKSPLINFIIVYFIFFVMTEARLTDERYFLPITICLLIIFIQGNLSGGTVHTEKLNEPILEEPTKESIDRKNKFFIYAICINMAILIVRLIAINLIASGYL